MAGCMVLLTETAGVSIEGPVRRAKIEARPNNGRYEKIERGCGYVAAKLAVREVGKLVTSPPPDVDLPGRGVS